MTSLREHCVEVSSLIEERLQLLDDKEKAWRALEQRMQDNAKQASNKITLNVGGKIFATSKTNLLRFEGSYFHGMLGSGHWKPDTDGAYFIDWNPKHFDRVLEYLRTGDLSFDGLRPKQVKQLRKTLDYLLLNSQIDEPLRWDPQYKASSIILSDDNRVAAGGPGGWRAVQSTTPRTRFTVRVKPGGVLMIGFAPRAGFDPDATTYNSCGWYLYTHTGALYAQGGVEGRAYSSRLAVGGTVTAVLDRQSKSISFDVNGQALGTAYRAIPAGDLFACVCIYHDDSVALETE